jgi:acyl carrier protein phosphodiesterase
VSEESLAALQDVRKAQPQLNGDALYEAVIARRLRCGEVEARAILQQTYESVEDWGSDRPPRLLDVVRYMIASEYLEAAAGAKGMSLDLSAFLAARIDPHL